MGEFKIKTFYDPEARFIENAQLLGKLKFTFYKEPSKFGFYNCDLYVDEAVSMKNTNNDGQFVYMFNLENKMVN
jgi:hypothetical protein